MTTRNPPTQCVPRRMPRITVISRTRIFRRSIFLMSGFRRSGKSCRSSAEEKAARYQEEFGLPEYDSRILTESRHLAALFEEVAGLCGNPKKAANWFMVEVLRLMKDKGVEAEKVRFAPQHLADLLEMVDKKQVSPQNARKYLKKYLTKILMPLPISKSMV